ncbi:alpha/beta hydrolase [Candidatus Roizmanbacteria bacterium]|nr:alpha/beta hydrolase [Candidatus Roizmanbacteria bacterium]
MFLDVEGKKIYYHKMGTGAPLLFVHGWGGSSASLLPLARLFTGHETIVLDLPGFGKSDLPDPSWGVQEYATLVNQFCLQLGLRNITYFGHSFGGSLGIYLASTKPDLFKKLILCNSAFKRTAPGKSRYPLLKHLPTSMKKFLYRFFYPNSDSMKYPQLETNFRRIITEDISHLLPMVKVPTLILWGSADKDTPTPMAQDLHEKIEGSTLKIFEGVTHGLPLKYPGLVYQEMIKFL